jgi:hypothetical protein
VLTLAAGCMTSQGQSGHTVRHNRNAGSKMGCDC